MGVLYLHRHLCSKELDFTAVIESVSLSMGKYFYNVCCSVCLSTWTPGCWTSMAERECDIGCLISPASFHPA